jgi:hypothetical protein
VVGEEEDKLTMNHSNGRRSMTFRYAVGQKVTTGISGHIGTIEELIDGDTLQDPYHEPLYQVSGFLLPQRERVLKPAQIAATPLPFKPRVITTEELERKFTAAESRASHAELHYDRAVYNTRAACLAVLHGLKERTSALMEEHQATLSAPTQHRLDENYDLVVAVLNIAIRLIEKHPLPSPVLPKADESLPLKSVS